MIKFADINEEKIKKELTLFVDSQEVITKGSCKRHLEKVLGLQPMALNEKPAKKRFKKILKEVIKQDEEDRLQTVKRNAGEADINIEVEMKPKKKRKRKNEQPKAKRRKTEKTKVQPKKKKTKKAKYGRNTTKMISILKQCGLANPRTYTKLKEFDEEREKCAYLQDYFDEQNIDWRQSGKELQEVIDEFKLRREVNELNRGTSEMISTRRSKKKVKYTYEEEELEDSFDEEEEESDYDEGQDYNVEDDMEDEDFDEVNDDDDDDEYDE